MNKERKISQYICSINDYSIVTCDSMVKCLPMERQVKYHRYKMENDKKRCAISALLLKYIVFHEYGIQNVGDWVFSEYGKPRLKFYPDIHFSISHSGEWVAVSVGAWNHGIDIEHNNKDVKDILDMILSRKEKKRNQKLTLSQLNDYLISTWNLKEAYVKMIGKGLCKSFTEIEIKKMGKNICLYDCGKEMSDIYIEQYTLDNQYWYSICAECEEKDIMQLSKVSINEVYEMISGV